MARIDSVSRFKHLSPRKAKGKIRCLPSNVYLIRQDHATGDLFLFGEQAEICRVGHSFSASFAPGFSFFLLFLPFFVSFFFGRARARNSVSDSRSMNEAPAPSRSLGQNLFVVQRLSGPSAGPDRVRERKPAAPF